MKKQHSFSSPENRCHLASSLKPEERELVVDSGASMHKKDFISKTDLSDAEMETLTKSCSPTMIITANFTKVPCNTENFVPIVVPGLSSGSSSKLAFFNFNDTFKTGT